MTGHVRRVIIQIDEKGCHICLSLHRNQGYPATTRNGRTTCLSRVIYAQEKGTIPDKMFILHSCDTPACINLEHLRIGTHQENVEDKVNRGRSYLGPRPWCSKLNQEKVNEIKKKIFDGINVTEIAACYGVKKRVIYNIKSGHAWNPQNRNKGWIQ